MNPHYQHTIKGEIWKPVNGWIHYEISNMGRVRSWKGGGGKIRNYPTILMNQVTHQGYHFIGLHAGGSRQVSGVHRLVANAFCDPRQPHHTEVRHLDGNPKNNRWDNLKWGTHQENHEDTVRHGRMVFGEKSPTARLTNDQAREIFASTERNGALADRFQVSPMVVVAIRNGVRWRQVTGGGVGPGAKLYPQGANPTKLTAETAREIFLSPESNDAMAEKYGVSASFVSHIRAGDKWAEATKGLTAPEYKRAEYERAPCTGSPLQTLTEEAVKDIFLSPMLGSEIAKKYDVTEGHVSQIRSGTSCTLITSKLVAPTREKQNHKITPETAKAIFLDQRSGTLIAAEFGVTRTMVSYIKNRKVWRESTSDLPEPIPVA